MIYSHWFPYTRRVRNTLQIRLNLYGVPGYQHSKDLKQFLLDGFKSTRALINEETGLNELIDVNTMLVDNKIKIVPDIRERLENYYGASVEEVNSQFRS